MESRGDIKQQLDDILTHVAKSQNIQNFDLNPDTNINVGDGFVAEFFTGEIHNNDTGETTSVAIKKAPKNEFDFQAIFNNEDLFYKMAFPELNILQMESGVLKPFDNIPKYFCGSMETKKQFIAMENLKPYDYVMFDKKEYFNEEHLEFIFKTYGKFHALSFVLRKSNPEKYENITKNFVDISDLLVNTVGTQVGSSISATIEVLNTEENKILYDAVKDLGENATKTFLKAFEYTGDHKCLIHGDCWSNNMLFKYSESNKLVDMKLIDFQLCRDSSPIHDLSYFFYSGASKKDFDNIENYLQIYHKAFVQFASELGCNPEELLSFDVFVNEWKENALLGVIFGIWLWQIKLIPKEEIQKLMKENAELSLEEQMKIWLDFMEKLYKTDLYKERTTPILIHAFEYGILNKDKIVKV